MTTILSQYMSLELPVINVTPDPLWSQDFLDDLNLIDLHNHTTGQGQQVPTAGININADLNFNNFSAVNLTSAAFVQQGSTLATPSSIYTHLGDLWYTNGAGTAVQITSGPSVNVTGSGGFKGDYTTAHAIAYFNSTANLFSYTNSINQFSSIQGSSLLLTNALGNTIQLQVDSTLTVDYTLTLPITLPSPTTPLPLTISNAGLLVAAQITGIEIANLAITAAQIANNTITGAQIANNTITSAQIANNTVTDLNLAPLNVSVSTAITASTTSVSSIPTGLSCPVFTTSGRPVQILLMSGPGNFTGFNSIGVSCPNATSPAIAQATFTLLRNGTPINSYSISTTFDNFSAISMNIPLSSIAQVDFVGAGVYNYTLSYNVVNTGNSASVFINNAVLVAYEIM